MVSLLGASAYLTHTQNLQWHYGKTPNRRMSVPCNRADHFYYHPIVLNFPRCISRTERSRGQRCVFIFPILINDSAERFIDRKAEMSIIAFSSLVMVASRTITQSSEHVISVRTVVPLRILLGPFRRNSQHRLSSLFFVRLFISNRSIPASLTFIVSPLEPFLLMFSCIMKRYFCVSE